MQRLGICEKSCSLPVHETLLRSAHAPGPECAPSNLSGRSPWHELRERFSALQRHLNGSKGIVVFGITATTVYPSDKILEAWPRVHNILTPFISRNREKLSRPFPPGKSYVYYPDAIVWFGQCHWS